MQIDPRNTSEDVKIWFFCEQVTKWFEELLNRKFTLQQRVEYYNGTGTQKLLLRSRPVFTVPTIQVYVQENGYYGSTSGAFTQNALTYGQDFCLQIDQDNGSSRSGILIRMCGFTWCKQWYRSPGLLSPYVGPAFGNIQCTYTAGFTVDTLPAEFRLAANYMIAKLRQIFPLGFLLNSESYEERSISMWIPQKRILLDEVWSMIGTHRNWVF